MKAKKKEEVEPKKAARRRKSESDDSEKMGAGTREDFLDALRDALGLVFMACKRVGITYDQYRAWLDESPEFAREVELVGELALDFVEGKALEEIRNGNARLIQFYLQTKGKKRGYDPDGEGGKKPVVALLSADEMEY